LARTKVIVDFKTKYFKKTRGNMGKLRANAKSLSENIAKGGRNFARSIAPNETGRMASFITVTPVNSGKNAFVYKVEALNPVKGGGTQYRKGGETASTNPKYNSKKTGMFDLVKWSHTSSHFNGGQPKFMFKAKGHIMKLRDSAIRSNVITKGIVK